MGGPQIVEVLDLKTVIAEAIDWNWSRQCMDRTLRLDELSWAVALIIWLGRLAQVFKMKRDANRLTLYEDSWASCLVATGDVFFCLSDSIRLRWLHIIKGVIERRTWLSSLAFCVLSACGWFDFVVAWLYSFIVDPGPYLFENGPFGSFETFTLAVKKTHLGVAGCTSCGKRFGGRGIRAEDMGEKWLILMPLKTRPVAMIRYQAYGGFGAYWGDTSDFNRSVADEDILKNNAREFLPPNFIFLTKTFGGIFQVALNTLMIEGECWNMQDTITVCSILVV